MICLGVLMSVVEFECVLVSFVILVYSCLLMCELCLVVVSRWCVFLFCCGLLVLSFVVLCNWCVLLRMWCVCVYVLFLVVVRIGWNDMEKCIWWLCFVVLVCMWVVRLCIWLSDLFYSV